MGVFNSDVGVGCKIIDFEGCTRVFSERFSDFGRFGPRQDTTIEPFLYWFRYDGRNAGLGGGLRARMAERICPKTLPDTATSASWKVILRSWRTTLAPILMRPLGHR